MPETAILAARFREEAAWFRLLAAAGQLERALKYNPNWHSQPRVPAGNGRESGQWADGRGGAAETQARPPATLASGRLQRLAQLRRRYPTASLAEITRLETAASQARYHATRARQLEPKWRGPASVTVTIRGEIRHLEAVARAAELRFRELTQGAIPGFNPLWGRDRLVKELYRHGYRLRGPARGNGLIYEKRETNERVRIMERPKRRFRNDLDAKHINQYYYRYRLSGERERPHVPIPEAG